MNLTSKKLIELNYDERHKRVYINLLCIYFILLPFNTLQLGNLGSLIKIIAIFPIAYAIINMKKFHFNNLLLISFMFVFYAGLSLMWSNDFMMSLDRVVSYVSLFSLIFSGSVFIYNNYDIKCIKKSLLWSTRLTALCMLLFADFIEGRFWLKGVMNEDPNYICGYFLFGIIFQLQVILSKVSIKKKIIPIIEVVCYLLMIFLTGSRGGLIAIVFAILVYFLFGGKLEIKSVIKKLLVLLSLFVICAVIIHVLPEQLKNRFTLDDIMANGGTGRIEIWKNAIDLFLNSSIDRKLFGYGTATIVHSFEIFGYSRKTVVHNIFLETLVELGFVGLIIYSLSIFVFIKYAFKNKDKFTFAVIIGMFVLSLSTSIYTFKPYFNIMLFIIICRNYSKSSKFSFIKYN